MIRGLRFVAIPLAILWLCAGSAFAHPRGQRPVLVVARTATGFDIRWVVAADDMVWVGESLALGPVRPASFDEYEAYRTYVTERLRVEVPGGNCVASVTDVTEVPTGFATRIPVECGVSAEEVRITSRLLLDLAPEYIHHLEVATPAGTRRGMLTNDRRTVEVSFLAAAPIPEEHKEVDARTRIEGLARGEGTMSIVFGIGLALVLGAVHGLTPGHGKTLTAAYIAGTHGTMRDATLLAGIVAVAHGASTLVLAAIASGIDKLAPERITPWLEGAMALLAAAVGIALLRGATLHTHSHGHEALPVRRLPLRQLAAIGLVGGLIPGPEAFAVGFLAVAHQQLALGLILVAAFSLGLAAVVFGVASLAVVAGKHLGTSHRAERTARRVGGVVFLIVAIILAMRAVSA